MEDDLLRVRRLVGDDAGAADLRAGAGRRRHGDDRRDPFGIGARPPVADILEIPHRPRLPGHEGDDLAGIERRAAAESDDAVMLAGLEDIHAALSTFASTGLGAHRKRCRGVSPPLRMMSSACAMIIELGEAGSVTSSGLLMPAACRRRQAPRCAPRRSGRRSDSSSCRRVSWVGSRWPLPWCPGTSPAHLLGQGSAGDASGRTKLGGRYSELGGTPLRNTVPTSRG